MKIGNSLIVLMLAYMATHCNAFWDFKWECRTNAQGDVGTCQLPLFSKCEGGSFHSSSNCFLGFRCCVPNPPPRQQVCTNLQGQRGVCLDTRSETCDGVFQRGFCRGSGIQCCVREIQTPPPFTLAPTMEPTKTPTAEPTAKPTSGPTKRDDTASPTATPTLRPSESPSASPSVSPSTSPTLAPIASKGPKLRKEASDLTTQEREDLINAINMLREEGTWDEFAAVHARFFSGGIHNGPQFWPWHRVFLLVLEEELSRVAGKQITYPYWDWTRNARNTQDAPVFEDSFFGGFAPSSQWSGCIESGPFVNWQPCLRRNRQYRGNTWDQVDVQGAFTRGNNVYDNVRRNVENLHNAIHNNIGGDMATINSPIDPVFWAHHAYIDKLWSDWQGLRPENERAYSAGLSQGNIIHYTQYTVEDTFSMRPYEGVETRRRLVQTVHKHLNQEAISKDRVVYVEGSRGLSASFSKMSKLSPQQLAKIPRTCAAPEPDSELIVFWNDDMSPFFEASAARVESTEGETDDCVNHAALNVVLGELDSEESSSFSTAAMVSVIGGVVAFSVIATVGAVLVYRRRAARQEETQMAVVELPEL